MYSELLSCRTKKKVEIVGESFVANNVSSTFKMKAVVLPKHMYLFTKPHCIRAQNFVLLKMFHFSR